MVATHDRFSAGKLAAAGCVVAYLIAAAVAAWAVGNREFIFYILVMVALLAVVWGLHMRVNLSAGVIWALAIWGGMHMAGGLVAVPASWPIAGDMRVLYSWWIIPGWFKYDHLTHAFGFGTTTFVCWQSLRAAVGPKFEPTIGPVALVAFAAMGLGALNEVVEFAATLLVPETNVGGYINTGWDLVANTAGAAIAGSVIWLRQRGARTPYEIPA